jgi:hypothetical protein
LPPLNVPNKPALATIPVIESRVPRPGELVVLSKPLLNATIRIGELLRGCHSKWALAGDVGEILFGVNVHPDHISILTTAAGCEEITEKLAAFRLEGPKNCESQVKRNAEIGGSPPVRVKSCKSVFAIEGERLEVHGDLQIKVGEWDWGDPLDYEPEYVYVVGIKVPVVPLELKTELYMGLGWIDRVRKIKEAMARRHHKI